ncbi:MAG: GNAT family N-acetyltransferase [Candidatus Thiodiazotropha sp.]
MSANNEPQDSFKIIAGDESHYEGIMALFTSPEELYLIFPSGSWPFDREQLERLSKQRSDFTVVLDDDRVIGFANIYTNTAGNRYFIGNVVISRDYRGQGVGRQLVGHMCGLIFEHYASTAYISVFAFNTTALLLYSSLGFKPYDIEQRNMPNGDLAALVHMRLD